MISTEHETPEGAMDFLAAMARTRLELAAGDLEDHLGATAASVALAVAAFVAALVALAFAGVVVIVLFWDTHRVLASIGALGGYVAIAILLAARARARWRSRPPAFAATLRELELDREAVREAA
ncbi:MAG TPA: phage holin family protein [Steroidobacteraceae bacterium]|nr:phage holin family protein [Steroidobacteraceae bacterium]